MCVSDKKSYSVVTVSYLFLRFRGVHKAISPNVHALRRKYDTRMTNVRYAVTLKRER